MTRLLDAIGENPLYASAIRLVQAQRLVRRLDDKTKKQITVDSDMQRHIEGVVDSIKADVDLSFLSNAMVFSPGSSPENPFGYNGQFAIRELLLMTPEMRQLLSRPAHELSSELIEEVAVKSGMLTMQQDGILHVLRGETTPEEINRVVG